ncbi:MAG: NB-ARC domain-containing protein [Saprospiraceae bacterium]
MTKVNRFRVAFSFSSEKWLYVSQVANILAKRFGKTAILYDKFHEAEFARWNLGIYLPELYHKETDLIVVVISPDYDVKQWTGLEWTAIYDLLKNGMNDKIMLCRFNSSTLPGLYSTAGFIECDTKTPHQLARIILDRIAINENNLKSNNGVQVDPQISLEVEAFKKEFLKEKVVQIPERREGMTVHTKVPHALTLFPLDPEVFFGREEDIQYIHKQLFTPNGNLLLLINGEGGIGKTSVASKYFHQYQNDYNHVSWVLSEPDIANALLLLAQRLGLKFDLQSDTAQRLDELFAALAELPNPSLLIIDNANDRADLADHYPRLRSCTNLHILLTSRINHFSQARTYHIGSLPEKEALKMFEKHYRRLHESERILFYDIRRAVGENTLVLELFAKNLYQINYLKPRYSLANMLTDLMKGQGLFKLSQEQEVETLYHAQGGRLRREPPEKIIAAMYDFGKLPPEEAALLSVFAALPAESIVFEHLETLATPFPVKKIKNKIGFWSMMLALFSKTQNKIFITQSEFENLLKSLFQKGWIEFNEETKIFRCSPLVQQIVREKNTKTLLQDCSQIIYGLIKKLEYQPGIGHLLNSTYEEAAIFVRYAEAIASRFEAPNHAFLFLYEGIANYHKTTGNLEQALCFYEKFSQNAKAINAAEPNDIIAKCSLGISYQCLGQTHTALGNLDQALFLFEEMSKLFEEMYTANSSIEYIKNSLAISYQFIGYTYLSLGDLDKALIFFEQYNYLINELHNAYPENIEFKLNFGYANQFLGITNISLGDLKKGLVYFEKMNQYFELLHVDEPQNVSFKNGLAISYSLLGVTHTSLGDLDKALVYFGQYNQLQKDLYDSYPQNVELKNNLAISYAKIGEGYSRLSNLDKALICFEQYNQLEKELYDTYPQNIAFKNGLANSYLKLGEIYRTLGNPARALPFFERYNFLEQELHIAYPSTVEFKHSLAISYSKLGDTHRMLEELEQTLVCFKQYNSLAQELYTDYPSTVAYKNSLAISYSKLGMIYLQLKNIQFAKSNFELFMNYIRDLYELFPNDIDFSSDFGEALAVNTVLNNLKNKRINNDDLKIALALFQSLFDKSKLPKYKRKIKLIQKMMHAKSNIPDLVIEISSF